MRVLLQSFMLLFMFSSMLSIAQCPLTEAVDFTATDTEGNEINLFSLLDEGKYVCIDFFYTTCGPCQQTAPKVTTAYQYFGCNTADVVFLGIDTGDTNEEVEQFDENFGVEYPAISGVEGGGTAIVSSYQIPAFPTVILIAPDKTIVEQDIWPIATAQVIVDALEAYGIEENSCGFNTEAEMLSFAIDGSFTGAQFDGYSISLEMHQHDAISALQPEFTLSEGAKAYIDDIEQVSGESIVDFSNGDVVYTVVSEDQATSIDYTVTVTNAVGIQEGENDEFVTISPNPVSDYMVFKINSENLLTADSKVDIYNSHGQLVESRLVRQLVNTNNSFEYRNNNLSNGTYFYTIYNKNQAVNGKFVVTQ